MGWALLPSIAALSAVALQTPVNRAEAARAPAWLRIDQADLAESRYRPAELWSFPISDDVCVKSEGGYLLVQSKDVLKVLDPETGRQIIEISGCLPPQTRGQVVATVSRGTLVVSRR